MYLSVSDFSIFGFTSCNISGNAINISNQPGDTIRQFSARRISNYFNALSALSDVSVTIDISLQYLAL